MHVAIKHFVPWFIISLVIYIYAVPLIGMYELLVIAFISLAIIIYIANFMKRMLPIALVAILASSIIYYLIFI